MIQSRHFAQHKYGSECGECRASKRIEHLAEFIMHWSQCYYDFLECKTLRHDQVAPEQKCYGNLLRRLCTGTHNDRQGIGFQYGVASNHRSGISLRLMPVMFAGFVAHVKYKGPWKWRRKLILVRITSACIPVLEDKTFT